MANSNSLGIITTTTTLLFLLLIFFLPALSSPFPSEKNLPYMTSDVKQVSGKSFDYIIVGGGTAGCPLAATLSERFSVLLVERGDSSYKNPLIIEKKYSGYSLLETDDFSSPAQSFVSDDGVANMRGRVLGGSSAINGGFYSRASREFVKRAGWDEEMVEKAFEWVESKVVFVPELTPWQSTAKLGLLEAGVVPYNGYSLEHVEGTKIGGTVFDRFGKRHSSANLLLLQRGEGSQGNVTVLLNATVKNAIFQSDGAETRAIGIEFIRSDGSPEETFKAFLTNVSHTPKGDVILSAGAIGSPTILLLSGLGPPKHLNKFDIPVVADLNEVGRGMKDNPSISLLADSRPHNLLPDPPQVAGVAKDFKIIIESIILPVSFNRTIIPVTGKLAFPESKGRLKLNSTDPRRNPLVKFNYLKKEEDLRQCVEMVELLQGVVNSRAVASFLGVGREIKCIREEISGFCRKNVSTFYHYHGGCLVGSVVDTDYRVYGVKGLRVIDGSTFEDSPGTNPMATVMMLGRYQGLKILQERESS